MNNHGGGYDGGAKSARVTSVVESFKDKVHLEVDFY